MLRRRLIASVVALLVLAFGGCRSPKPNAPKHEVDQLLSQLGRYCGLATELRAFGPGGPRLAALDSKGRDVARRLVGVMRSNPKASYLGQSMGEVVQGAVSETRECGLTHASAELSSGLSKSR